MPDVIRIVEYKNRELVEFLEEHLEKARQGEITGMAAVVRIGPFDHGMVLLGEYSRNPASASAPVGSLFSAINNRIRELGLITVRDEKGKK